MDSFEPKKLALIRILHILERYTDSSHPMTHDEIINKLYNLYGISVERKAIGRNISLLQDAGYDIETTKKGSYLNSRVFEDAELRLLSDSVLASQHITAKHSKELIDKIASLSNKYFKSHIKNIYSVNDWNKSENVALFYNIDIIDEAIETNRKIKFDYNKYGTDKKLHRSAFHIVSPYSMKNIYLNVEFKDPETELKAELQRSGARNVEARRNYNGELEVRYTIKAANPQKDIEDMLNKSGGKNVHSSSSYNGARFDFRVDDIVDERVFKQKIIETLRRAGYRAN